MASKKQRYGLQRIRQQYTYSVYEVAELFDITPDTVFRWIRNDGLPRIKGSNKYYVHGSNLHSFLQKKNQKHKHRCQPDEMYCCKCRAPTKPIAESVGATTLANNTQRARGQCNTCGTTTSKVIGVKDWNETHPFFCLVYATSTTHDVVNVSLPECQTQLVGTT